MGRWDQVRVFLSFMDHFVNFSHPKGSDSLPLIATCNFQKLQVLCGQKEA